MRVAIPALLLLLVAGCDAPTARFSHPAEYDSLSAEGKEAVDKALESRFGTPDQIVAWKSLPIEFGGTEGTLTQAEKKRLTVRFDAPPPVATKGTKLAFLSGRFAGRSVTVESFDRATGQVTIQESLSETPAEGDRVVIEPAPTLALGKTLYLEHCLHCHGISGDGNGPTARSLSPRPRDFRKGIFKFSNISEQRTAAREDIERIMVDGIPGTYMPSFRLLEPRELSAITEYVRWLAMRGKYEDTAVALLGGRGEGSELDEYLKSDFADDLQSRWEVFADEWRAADTADVEIRPRTAFSAATNDLAKWLSRNRTVMSFGEFTKDPEDDDGDAILHVRFTEGPFPNDDYFKGSHIIILTGKSAGFSKQIDDADADENTLGLDETKVNAKAGDLILTVATRPPAALAYLAETGFNLQKEIPREIDAPTLSLRLEQASVERGRTLYASKAVNCVQCHGSQYRGDGPKVEQFSKHPDTGEPYSQRGLHDTWHQPVKPRDLTRGIFRGGRRPIDLYSRITSGIKGTEMPPSGKLLIYDKGDKKDHDLRVWDVVRFILAVPHE